MKLNLAHLLRLQVLLVIIFDGNAALGGSLDLVKLELQWEAQFQFAGYYAAAYKGYYRESGLEVQFRRRAPGTSAATGILTGTADFSTGSSSILLDKCEGKPIVLLSSIFQHSPMAVMVRAQSPFTSPQDLAGARVMFSPHSIEVLAMLRSEGLSANDLRAVTPTGNVEAFVRKEVDAQVVYTTNEPFLVENKGVQIRLIHPAQYGIDFYGDSLITTERKARNEAALVKRFRDASHRGWSYALANPEEIIDVIMREYDSGKTREALRFEADAIRKLVIPSYVNVGHTNPDRWQRMVQFYRDSGLISRSECLRDFFFDDLLNEDLARKSRIIATTSWTIGALVALIVLATGIIWRYRIAVTRKVEEIRAVEQKYHNFFESMRDAFALVDMSGKIREFNNAFHDLIGHPEDQIPNLTFTSLTPPKWHALEEDILRSQVLIRGFSEVYEKEYIRFDGTIVPVTLRTHLMRDTDGTPIAMWAFIRDISDMKKTQLQLENAKESAEVANRAKDTFLANMSHEIRTPLNGVVGMAELLALSALDDRQREFVNGIQASLDALLCIVNDILDFAKLEAGRTELHPEPMSVHAVVNDVMRLFRAICEKKKLEQRQSIAADVPETVVGDPWRLKQILSNLIGNAVKFTSQGHVGVTVMLDDASEERVRLHFIVDDSGVGISREDASRLFEPFVQVGRTISGKSVGSGLGLSICRDLVRLFGGELWLAPPNGSGSQFHFTVSLGLPSRNDS